MTNRNTLPDQPATTTDTLRIIEVWKGRVTQGIVYEGTPEAIIAHGLAAPEHFTNKSGTKSFKDTDGHSWELKRRAGGIWRVQVIHLVAEAPLAPLVPNPDEIVSFQSDHEGARLQLTAASALGSGIAAESYECKDGRFTRYTGTKAQLVGAGLAVDSMFPRKGRHSRTRKWSSPEQGTWEIDRPPGCGPEQDLWSLLYRHEDFEMPPEVKQEANALRLYEVLKRRFGDDDGTHCYG